MRCAVRSSQRDDHQFLRDVLVEDFLHGQGDDDFMAALEERFDLRQAANVAQAFGHDAQALLIIAQPFMAGLNVIIKSSPVGTKELQSNISAL